MLPERPKACSPIQHTRTLTRSTAGMSFLLCPIYLAMVLTPKSCSWDTYRTYYPLMALHSPAEFAQIVDSYVDGWRKNGWMPECRANNLPGWTQGGSSGDNIVGHFAINYHNEASKLGIDLDELYSAMLADGDSNPFEWDVQGREVDVYKFVGSSSGGVLLKAVY